MTDDPLLPGPDRPDPEDDSASTASPLRFAIMGCGACGMRFMVNGEEYLLIAACPFCLNPARKDTTVQ